MWWVRYRTTFYSCIDSDYVREENIFLDVHPLVFLDEKNKDSSARETTELLAWHELSDEDVLVAKELNML